MDAQNLKVHTNTSKEFSEQSKGITWPRVVIFFSLTEPPLPDPTPTRPNTPRLARSRQKSPETDRNGSNWTCNIVASFLRWGKGGGVVSE